MAQHQFLGKYQASNQTITEYVTYLKTNIRSCEFKCSCQESIADVFLRAQFIRGISCNYIREQLLQCEDMSFEALVEKAVLIESSNIGAQELSKVTTNSENNINKVSKRPIPQSVNKRPYKYQRKGKRQSRSSLDYADLGIDGLCLRCGKDNHLSKNCRIERSAMKCTYCRKDGHVSRVCISKRLSEKREEANVIEDEQEEDIPYDVFQIAKSVTNNNERFLTSVKVEGKLIEFEVDSGSGYTFLPRKIYKTLNMKEPLNPTPIRFQSYAKNVFEPDGIAHVRALYKRTEIDDQVFIVPDQFSPIVGRIWIRRLGINILDIDEKRLRDRETPQKNGKTPAEKYLNHTTRINLDAIEPSKRIPVMPACIPMTRQIKVGKRVQARFFKNNKLIRKNGTIVEKYGQLQYMVQLDDGNKFKRHIDQLHLTAVERDVKCTEPQTKSWVVTRQKNNSTLPYVQSSKREKNGGYKF